MRIARPSEKMEAVFSRLQRQNAQISYQTNGLGFVEGPGGSPTNVTVMTNPAINEGPRIVKSFLIADVFSSAPPAHRRSHR
jgi:hypothetical protein